jgi:hypothetical protein
VEKNSAFRIYRRNNGVLTSAVGRKIAFEVLCGHFFEVGPTRVVWMQAFAPEELFEAPNCIADGIAARLAGLLRFRLRSLY